MIHELRLKFTQVTSTETVTADLFSLVALSFASIDAALFPPMETVHRRKCRRRTSSRQSHESDAEDAVARESGSEKTLSALLENHEDLFVKVLSYVMDDGLHECRRVCRLWRDACGKLPVHLGGSSLDKLNRVMDLFPNAVSLSLERSFDINDILGRQAMQNLTRLSNLRSLRLSTFDDEANVRRLTALLPTTDSLRSFNVRIETKDILDNVVHTLRILTNLEALTISITRFIQTDLDPVTELQGLSYLNAYLPLIVNSSGKLLFPSPRLRHLKLSGDIDEHDESRTYFRLRVCKFR